MPPRAQQLEQTRLRLLDATVAVLQQQGVQGFTLDAVAQQAGISKGGLLHHFPTKETLIVELVRTMMARFEASVTHFAADEPDKPDQPDQPDRPSCPGRLLRAYVRASCAETPIFPALGALLAVSLHDNPALAALVAEDARFWQERLHNDGLPPARVEVVRRAADAAWYEQLIGAAPESPTQQDLIDELLALCTPGQPSGAAR